MIEIVLNIVLMPTGVTKNEHRFTAGSIRTLRYCYKYQSKCTQHSTFAAINAKFPPVF